jgi:hypothetical protein
VSVESGRIAPRWLPWLRGAWALLTLASLWLLVFNLRWLHGFFAAPPAWLREASAATGIGLGVVSAAHYLFTLLMFAGFFSVAQVIFLRQAGERFPVLVAVVLLCMGAVLGAPGFSEYLQLLLDPPPQLGIPFTALNFLAWTLIMPFIITYPDGRFQPRWTLWAALFGSASSAFATLDLGTFTSIDPVFQAIIFTLQLSLFVPILFVHVWRYRRYLSPTQRTQVRWFVYGLALATASIVTAGLLNTTLNNPATPPVRLFWAVLANLLIWSVSIALPLAVGFAILRYRLWDIDILIRRTLQYSLLTGLLALAYFGGVVILQGITRPFTGSAESPLVTVITTLGIAALFTPLRRRVQAFIDRRFYRKKYNAEQALAQFAATARDEVDMDKLAAALVGVVEETVQPERVSLWLVQEKRS